MGDVKGVVKPENREEGWSTVITLQEIEGHFCDLSSGGPLKWP